jgi:hypothetical protein
MSITQALVEVIVVKARLGRLTMLLQEKRNSAIVNIILMSHESSVKTTI